MSTHSQTLMPTYNESLWVGLVVEGQMLKNASAQNLGNTNSLTSKHSSFLLIKVPHCNSISGN